MSGQKAIDASLACSQLVRELAKPCNKGGFFVSVIDFADTAKLKHDCIPAEDLVQNLKPISTGGGTNITAALELAIQLCKKAQKGDDTNIQWLRPVVVLFSDGGHNIGSQPGPVAKELRRIADIVTIAYGSDADIGLLREIATSPQHHYKCNNGKDLRQFLAAVGETMTSTLASGVDATKALAHVQQISWGGSSNEIKPEQ